MKISQQFWRGLYFLFLIAALCGGLALPVGKPAVHAAPQRQAAATDLVISEFRFRGSGGAGDEFVEIYNPTGSPVNLNGWKIGGSNNAGGASSRYTFSTNFFLQPGQHYLVANTSYDDAVTADATFGSGITDDGGVALLRPDNSIADQAGMTAACLPNTCYVEGTPLTSLGSTAASNIDRSYERKLGGASDSCQDTNDNSADFQLLNPSGPQNRFSPLSLCGAIPPTATDTSTPTSTATATSTGTATGTATTTATATNTSSATSATSIVISEFRTRGPNGANDEFIEIYNPTTNWVDISSWKINASNDAGGTDTRATIPPSTILRSGQYYLVANNSSSGGYSGSVAANLTYGTGIVDTGGIALLRADNTVVDQVGMSTGSAYKEGTTVSALSGNSDQSYERNQGGDFDSCEDTNNNANDFTTRTPSAPHNYSFIRLCGTARSSPVTTTTVITGDYPDPSSVNTSVSVTVTVTGGSPAPTGKVNISGANVNCTINLSASGTGSCFVTFTSTGTKTLTATYLGDNTHLASSGTQSHQVITSVHATATKYRTPTPKPLPPPPLLVINEFVPRPGHDWNLDGSVNAGDEYIEILNHGVIDVNLSGYSLDDEVNVGSAPYRLPSITLKPGERHVFYGSETGLLLSDGGDAVRLLKPNGQLMDAYNYFVVRYPDESYCRLPDNGGADDWNQNCFPTPGLQNSLSGNAVNPPQTGGEETSCPIADTLPDDFVLAECLPFGNNIWNPAYWDKLGWFDEKYLNNSPGKWPLFAE